MVNFRFFGIFVEFLRGKREEFIEHYLKKIKLGNYFP
jgi:hypothetical protein